LPIEQLLSDVAGASGPSTGVSPTRTPARPAIVASTPEGAPGRPNQVSPFDADSARKGGPRQESPSNPAPGNGPRMVASGSPPARVVMGAAAPVDLTEEAADLQLGSQVEPQLEAKLQTAPALSQARPPAVSGPGIERLQSAVLQALADGNQRILVSMLEAGEWAIEGNEVVIKVSESRTVVDMSLGAEARRLAVASASGVLGRPVKLRTVSGATVPTAGGRSNGGAARTEGPSSGVGGRSRAEQDAVVRRLQEKFGAEIRTVIDYKEKR
jgi:hypothetical protein